MKQPIRYFSIGLLTASLILLIIVLFFDKSDDNLADQPVDQMIDTLKNEGYHVLSSDEYITLSMSRDQVNDDKKQEDTKEKEKEKEKEEKQEQDKEKEKDKEKDKEKEKTHKYTLTIEENMLGPTISELLKKNKIISDTDKFNRYLETEGYAAYLQLGDHKVSSDMSHYEIAETIARKR